MQSVQKNLLLCQPWVEGGGGAPAAKHHLVLCRFEVRGALPLRTYPYDHAAPEVLVV
jgi:hypothetical protein